MFFAPRRLAGSTVFAHVHLREYPVFFGALAATLTEVPCASLAAATASRSSHAPRSISPDLRQVYEPLGLNDNLTIPLFSSIALQWGFARIQTCAAQPPLGWLKEAYLALR